MQPKTGSFSIFTTVRTKPDIINNDMESHSVIKISDYLAAAMYSESSIETSDKTVIH
jgi:hypothetical protein